MGAPPLTDIYGAGRGSASTAEWESESKVQQDVIRTEWHGQKSRLRGYELVTGQVSGCAERSSSKPARWHVADSNSIYMGVCNGPSRWRKLNKIVDSSFFFITLQSNENWDEQTESFKLIIITIIIIINFLKITKHSHDVRWFARNYMRRLFWHKFCRAVIFWIS